MNHLRKSFPYLAAFFVMLAGSGLVKFPEGSLWFYGIRYGISAIVLGLAVYFYFKNNTMNYLLLAIFVPFTNDYALHIIFVVLTVILFNKKLLLPFKSPLKPIYILFFLGFASYIINQFIEFNPLSYPIFVGHFFLTFVFFSLFFNYAYKIDFSFVKNHFFNLVLIMIGLIVAQIIFLPDTHPDYWHGGTDNAHVAGIFLSLAFIFIAAEFIKKDSGMRFNLKQVLIAVFTFPILFFIDAKTIFVFTLSVFLCIVFINLKKSTVKIAYLFTIICLVLLWYNYSDRRLPISILSLEENVYYINDYTSNYTNTDKFHLIEQAGSTFKNDLYVALIGGGPGTFLSQTAVLKKRIIERVGREKPLPLLNNRRDYIKKICSPPDSWVKIKYAGINFEKRPKQSMFDWRSSLINLFFEFGLLGLIIFLSFIYLIFVRALHLFRIDRINGFTYITFITLFLILFYLSDWGESMTFGICMYSILGYYAAPTLYTN